MLMWNDFRPQKDKILCKLDAGFRWSKQWFCFFFYLPYLSFIYERANCIAIFLTGRRTRFGVAISEVSGPPVFYIKAGASH